MYAFTFHRPQTVRQAANLLDKNEDAKLLAGGQTLLPTMKLRLAGPPQIVDMTLIEGLSGIELSGRSLDHRRDDDATTRCNTSPVVQQAIPVLGQARRHDRRSGGAPSRHDRRLDRQQRSEC